MSNQAPEGCGSEAEWGIRNSIGLDREILGLIFNVEFHPTSPIVYWTTKNAAGNLVTKTLLGQNMSWERRYLGLWL